MKNLTTLFYLLFITLLSSCAATSMNTYKATGGDRICANTYLGNVVILPEVAWRSNQKEPEKREKMALEEIRKAFDSFPCGEFDTNHGISEIADWSARPESELLSQFLSNGIDTVILIRIEELTPRLNFTFSIPFLWAGTNEADFRVRVIATKSGKVLNDMRVKRLTGGPFNIRPADWSGEELYAALKEVIGY